MKNLSGLNSSLSRTLLGACLLAGLLISASASASLNEFETILVKGYQNAPDSVPGPLGDNLDVGFDYTMLKHVDYVDPGLGWRNSGGGRDLYEYLRGNPDDSSQWPVKCKEGCVLVTASTGDLVTRVFLENQAAWATEDGIEPFNVIATIDFVGAGGGTEVADLWIYDGFREWYQENFGQYFADFDSFDAGSAVASDLRPHHARAIADRFNEHRVPRFRISANFLGPLGFNLLIPWELSITNDGLVPAHSTCGCNKPELLLTSCVDNVNYDGYTHAFGLEVVDASPENFGAGLWPYHYPVIMASGGYHHGNTHLDAKPGSITYVEKKPEENGAGFNFNTDSHTDWGPYYISGWKNCGWRQDKWYLPYYWKCDPVWKRDIITRYQWINGESINRIVHDTFFYNE